MKKNILKYRKTNLTIRNFLMLAIINLLFLNACDEDVLTEEPLDFLSSDIVLTDEAGFESAIVALNAAVRNVFFYEDGAKQYSLQLGTDVATVGEVGLPDFLFSASPAIAARADSVNFRFTFSSSNSF